MKDFDLSDAPTPDTLTLQVELAEARARIRCLVRLIRSQATRDGQYRDAIEALKEEGS